jgi:uncharacterized repeat protein (TIGR04138 family)
VGKRAGHASRVEYSAVHIDFRALQANAGPYPPAAFEFVRLGLAHTARMVHGEPPSTPGTTKVVLKGPAGDASKLVHPSHLIANIEGDAKLVPSDESRHVSGAQLCQGLRDYALRQYGLLAGMVLRSWGIRGTSDFGNIVFGMISIGLFRKTEDDTREEFDNVYDFAEAFPDALVPSPAARHERGPGDEQVG